RNQLPIPSAASLSSGATDYAGHHSSAAPDSSDSGNRYQCGRSGDGDSHLYPTADGLMRGLGVSATILVFGGAAFFGLSGRWPWHRLSSSPPSPITVTPSPVTFTETVDTLHRGETLSDLFGRHDVVIDFQRL